MRTGRPLLSTIKDALSALKSVMIMQSQLAEMRKDMDIASSDLRGLKDYTHGIDKRVVRLETLVEAASMTSSRPQIERRESE